MHEAPDTGQGVPGVGWAEGQPAELTVPPPAPVVVVWVPVVPLPVVDPPPVVVPVPVPLTLPPQAKGWTATRARDQKRRKALRMRR